MRASRVAAGKGVERNFEYILADALVLKHWYSHLSLSWRVCKHSKSLLRFSLYRDPYTDFYNRSKLAVLNQIV